MDYLYPLLSVIAILNVLNSGETLNLDFVDADSIDVKDVKNSIIDNSVQSKLESFNIAYLTSLDQKISSLLSKINVLEQNLKLLLEKSQTLDFFQFQISAWSDQLQTIDEKLKLNYNVDDKIANIEYKIENLNNGMDYVKEKISEPWKSESTDDVVSGKLDKIIGHLDNQSKKDKVEQKDGINRLNAIQRQLAYIERNQYEQQGKKVNPKKEIRILDSESVSAVKDNSDINGLIEEFKKISETISRCPMENIEMIIQDNINTQKELKNDYEKIKTEDRKFISDIRDAQVELLNSCKNIEMEINSLSQWSEQSVKTVKGHIDQLTDEMKMLFGKVNESSGIHSLENENHIKETTANANLFINPIDIVISESSAIGCHQLKFRENGTRIFNFDLPEINESGRNFNERYCDFSTEGVAWTVIQRRDLYDELENFNRSWSDYKNGFGNLSRDFWFGNDFIHRLSYMENLELRIELENWTGDKEWVEYGFFRIDTEQYNYNLQIGGYRGSAPDSLSYHNDQDFSTFDKQNDNNNSTCCPCAESYGSGWWFNNCIDSNLNGIYQTTPKGHNYIGIIWEKWLHDYSLKKTKMMVRPKDLWFGVPNF